MYKQINLISFSLDENNEQPLEISLKDRKFTCPKCDGQNVIPYNDSKVIGKEGDRIISSSFDNVLTNGDYKCPKCKKMSLKFFPSFYMWD